MSKRTVLRSFAMLFVVVGLAAYALYLMTGRLPQLPTKGAVPGSSLPGMGTLAPLQKRDAGDHQVMQGGDTTVYKWQDAQGRWYYGSRAPAEAKLLQQMSIEPAPVAAAAQPAAVTVAAEPASTLSANPYSADGVKQLMERAEEARRLMQQRNSQLEQTN